MRSANRQTKISGACKNLRPLVRLRKHYVQLLRKNNVFRFSKISSVTTVPYSTTNHRSRSTQSLARSLFGRGTEREIASARDRRSHTAVAIIVVTMVLPLAAAAARRNAGKIASQAQRRTMAGSHGPAKEWEGIDKVVRGYFPEDHQLAMAIMGGYGGLFVLFKIKSAIGGKKVVEEVAAAASSSPVIATTGIPPVDSPEFDKYLETDAFYKMLDSDDQLGKVVEDMK